MKLSFIGNGSAFNIARGNNSAYYLEGNKILILDCGESIFERIIKSNILDKANEVFVAITHLHSDHVGSLPSLIFYNYYKKGIKTHIVSGPPQKDEELSHLLTISGVKGIFNYCDSDLNNSFVNLKSCTFTPVSHTSALTQSYVITLNFSSQKIYYSGDTNDEDYIKKVAQNLKQNDEFYCDTCLADYPGNVHTNIDRLATLVPLEKRQQVYCMHIDDDKILDKIDKYGFHLAKTQTEKQKNQEFGS